MATINPHRPASGFGTVFLGVACLAVFAALIVFWVKHTAPTADQAEQERGTARTQKRTELEKTWAGKLQQAAWIDKGKGVVQLPIDDAIMVVSTELKNKKVAKTGVKVPVPVPAPVADPKSTEPPPALLPSAPQGAEMIHFSTTPSAASETTAPATTPAKPLTNRTESK